MARVSGQQRIELWSEAEQEIQRYAHDHYLWHKHVHNVELDAIQILKCQEMDEYKMTLDFSSRRMGKTAVKELYLLKYLACFGDQELGIVAPREAQAMVNLGYHHDAIRRSPMLSAYIDVQKGRQQQADTYYQFANRSKASAYGIMANVDGGDITIASLEEVDDMPHERLFSRFLLMMGSTRRLGASKTATNEPQIRITGVYKGADTLVDLITSGKYHAIGCFHGDRAKEEIANFVNTGYLQTTQADPKNYTYPVPIGNAVNGMALGLLDKGFLLSMREQLGEDEFARQLLCVNTQSRNLIWQEWLQRAVQMGVKAQLEPVIPVPGAQYEKRGLLAMGYDHTGHGEKPESSRSAVVIVENLSGWLVPLYARTWPPGTDENSIRHDLVAIWDYFRPDRAMGDAFGVGLIGQVNDDLYSKNLIRVDRNTIGDGQSLASNWGDWAFAPIRFEGMAKHSMATSLASAFSAGRVALPYVNHLREGDGNFKDVEALQQLYRQLVNIEALATKKAYASYKMLKRDIGDDCFDAMMAANWALMSGQNNIPTAILLGGKTREQLLEKHPA